MRPLMKRAYSLLLEGYTPIVVAPTSYGKTRASPEIRERACEDGISCGLIHIAPLRSLVYSIYAKNFKPHGGAYQMHDPTPGEDKSPYFLRDLVVTTIDSYLWNLYRVPVAEYSVIERRLTGGHYYPIYASIFTSINVFDEAHLYLGYGDSSANYAAVKASVSTLARIGVPTIIETATLDSNRLKEIHDLIAYWGGKPKILSIDCNDNAPGPLKSVDSETIVDNYWIDHHRIPWTTRLVDGWGAVLDDMINDSAKGVVLAVTNTVRSAVSLYNKLASLANKTNAGIYLIHGRLSERERRSIEERIMKLDKGIGIGTQVIEAGVDVNAIAVYTELAPIENLAQRIGRACRRDEALSRCKKYGGRVTIVTRGDTASIYPEDRIKRTLEVLRSYYARGEDVIDWRLPCDLDGKVSYSKLLEEVAGPQIQSTVDGEDMVLFSILRKYLEKDAGPLGLLDLLSESGGLCSIYRKTVMAQVHTSHGPVTVSLEWILNHAASLLDLSLSGAPKLILVDASGAPGSGERVIGEVEASNLWKTWNNMKKHWKKYGGIKCNRLNKALEYDLRSIAQKLGNSRFTWRFKAKENAYIPGKGLLLGKELPGAR